MIAPLEIVQLVENMAGGPGLLAELGISLFIEADGNKILFDTGQDLTLRQDIEPLDNLIQDVESIVLSHGHYDHAVGLADALDMTGPSPLWSRLDRSLTMLRLMMPGK